MVSESYTEHYGIQWANNQKWNIILSEEVSDLLRPVISISSLPSVVHDDAPKIVFRANKPGTNGDDPLGGLSPDLRAELPRQGWYKVDRFSCLYWFHPDESDVLCELKLDDVKLKEILNSKRDNAVLGFRYWKVISFFTPIMLCLQRIGGLNLHAGLVERDGMGVVLSASGNIGKSTTCRRLPAYWKVHCDDRTVVVRGADKSFWAHPLPTWSEYIWNNTQKSYDIHHSIPLRAIFFLEQASGDEVIPLGKGAAAARLFQTAVDISRPEWKHIDEQHRRIYHQQAASSAVELAKEIPAYILRLSLSGRFWEKLEPVLNELGDCNSG